MQRLKLLLFLATIIIMVTLIKLCILLIHARISTTITSEWCSMLCLVGLWDMLFIENSLMPNGSDCIYSKSL